LVDKEVVPVAAQNHLTDLPAAVDGQVRARTLAAQVAQVEDQVDAARLDVGQDHFQRRHVAVDVRDHRDFIHAALPEALTGALYESAATAPTPIARPVTRVGKCPYTGLRVSHGRTTHGPDCSTPDSARRARPGLCRMGRPGRPAGL